MRAALQSLLDRMTAEQATVNTLSPAVTHFLKVTANYSAGLFHCYAVPDLPSTNNDLERRFGMLRYHERRATGRRSLPGGAVLRGSVRIVTVLAADHHDRGASGLRLTDRAAWQALRRQLENRQETRRAQYRFRKAPEAYLATLEQQLLQ